MKFKAEERLRYLKIGVALNILIALFMSYQIPSPSIQKIFKVIFMSLALLCMILVLNHKSEKPKRWMNILLTIAIIVTSILYLMEK
ncbi:hypothetical protein EGI22_09640 [Lacihabitans sp. LS3-19]|uniref:hypothetical protein n=1 Tax=Lacihabitans sp. LS3-19 TaxID=2487335 RepID=UPI0020CBDAE3|nr:hypothetical protein [Lacihabitans sp. LS3-19]MCP9768175.1 hypothetical protein [Lacihabitans sp. LS3-19]